MKRSHGETKAEKEFLVSWYIIAYKFIFGLIEFLSGVGIAFLGRQMLRLYRLNVARELSEDPHDLLSRVSERIIPNVFAHQSILVFTLILLGAAKIAGAIGLMYKKNWGVDLLVGLTVLMLPFQVVNVILHPSIVEAVYITIGLIISLYLIEFKPKAWISRVLQKQF